MLWRMPEMVAPRALVFRPLVKENEALGTRLKLWLNEKKKNEAKISTRAFPLESPSKNVLFKNIYCRVLTIN